MLVPTTCARQGLNGHFPVAYFKVSPYVILTPFTMDQDVGHPLALPTQGVGHHTQMQAQFIKNIYVYTTLFELQRYKLTSRYNIISTLAASTSYE